MKTTFIFFVFLFSSLIVKSQECKDSIKYEEKMQVAKSHIASGDFSLAYENYKAATYWCNNNSVTVEEAKEALFRQINIARENAILAQKEADSLRLIAEERFQITEASKLAFLADSESENGNVDDAFALAYEAYQLVKDNPIPAVKQAFGNAVNRKFGRSISIDNAITKSGFFPDSNKIFMVSRDHKVYVYDIEGILIAKLDHHADHIFETITSPKGNYLLTISKDKTANLWDKTGKLLYSFTEHGQEIKTSCFSSDESKLMTGFRNGMIKIWDVPTGKVLYTSNVYNGPVISAESTAHMFLTRSVKKVMVYDWSGKEIAVLHHNDATIYSAIFSADGLFLLTASADKTAKIWKNDGTLLHTLKAHEGLVPKAIFSKDGSKVLTCSADATARVWDNKGKELKTLIGHNDMVRSCLFAPNDQLILTVGNDHKIILWNQKESKIEFDQHKGKIETVAFSPNSQYILSAAGGVDCSAKMWDTNGDLIMSITFKAETQATFSSDGQFILASSMNGTTRICPLPDIVYEQIQKGKENIPKISEAVKAKYNLTYNH